MQWLIDLVAERVIATIGIPPVFVYRGNYGLYDFHAPTLIADSNWHELDLSGLVPEKAKCVLLHAKMKSDTIGGKLRFRPLGDTNSLFRCNLRTQVANIEIGAYIPAPLGTGRKIEYQYSDATFDARYITVMGWWF